MKIYDSSTSAARAGYVRVGHPAIVIFPKNGYTSDNLFGAYYNAIALVNDKGGVTIRYSALCANIMTGDVLRAGPVLVSVRPSEWHRARTHMFAQAHVTQKTITALRNMDLEFHIVQALRRKSKPSKR